MKKTQKTILDRFEIRYGGRVFRLAIFVQGCITLDCGHMPLEKIEQIFPEYLQLLQSHGYEFRKWEYDIPIVIKRLRNILGNYNHKRKEISIARKTLNGPSCEFYETLVHELTHYFIFCSWRHFQFYKEHFESPCFYFHEGLADLLTNLTFAKETIHQNPYYLDCLHIQKFRNRHFSYYLAEIFFRHPVKFREVLCGHFLRSEKTFRKMDRLVSRLSLLETESLNSLNTVRATFIISADDDRASQQGYAVFFEPGMDIPVVSPIDQDEVKRAHKAGRPVICHNPLFRVLKKLIKKDFTPLPEELFKAVVEILADLARKNIKHTHQQTLKQMQG